ncbi:putative mitochondrial protein, conserved [Rhizophlyctis rosea]|uniref:Succinate dehydrogenase assembly factor 4, mitochondrial n=1 Tax=Rhizophlyctis rosea TaxID=64517 RepID=A0AAD5S5X5_9FUNG|nr:putative mitochondrial protein, conserved [Rhizophlyctis rosea]
MLLRRFARTPSQPLSHLLRPTLILLRPSSSPPAKSSPPPKSPSPPTPPFTQSPGPLPLGDPAAQRDFENLLKNHSESLSFSDIHPDAPKPVASEFEGDKNPVTGEIGGPKGKEPTRYGDWERKGRVYDF